jgi:hypothetical protein
MCCSLRIRQICYNDQEDIFTLDEWESLTVPELRTVVALMDDGGAELISNSSNATSPRRTRRGTCFLLEGLVRWIRQNATNPRTRRPITPRQRQIIENAYRRTRAPRPRPPNNPLQIPESEDAPGGDPFSPPQAPRTQRSTQFFNTVQGAGGGGGRTASTIRMSSTTRQQLNGRTIININGQRHTAQQATLSVTRARVHGQDSFIVTIEYPNSPR